MNSTELMIKYKHDIIGQFRDLKDAIESLEPADFESAEKLEVFHAVHEVLLKMVRTSRNTMVQNIKYGSVLALTDSEPDMNLSKIEIFGVTLRFNIINGLIKYYLHISENVGNPFFLVCKVQVFLPLKKIENHLKAHGNDLDKIIAEINYSERII